MTIQLDTQAEEECSASLFKLITDFLKEHKERVMSFQHININIYASTDDNDDGQGDYHRVDMRLRTAPFGNLKQGRGKLQKE